MKILKKMEMSDSITAFAVESPYPRPNKVKYGIDPGTVNIGVAYVHPTPNVAIMLYQIKLELADTTLGRIHAMQDALTRCSLLLELNAEAIIEGASFAARYRQVELAEVRAAAVMWFDRYNITAHVVPPTTIRKQVFGNGKTKNPWKEIPDDVAAALGCAYYDSSNISTSSS